MKKVLSFVLVLCMLLSTLPAFAEETEENTIPDTWVEFGDFWVEVGEGYSTIVGIANSYSGKIIVTDEMSGYAYTQAGRKEYFSSRKLVLAPEAFKGCPGIHTIEFKAGIESIPHSLCEEMPDLKTVILPKELYAIDNNAFKGCESLEKIDLSHVQYIGRGAFEGCISLKTIELSTSLETIEAYAFKDCKKLSKIDLANVKTIGNDAFAGTGVILPEEKPEFLYSDVNGSDEYTKAVEVLSELGIMEGFDDGTFKPEGTLTRAEAAAIMARLLKLENEAEQGKTNFSDVGKDHWASGYINVAEANGIINGQGDGTFDPEEHLTYNQMLKMLVCTLGYEPVALANGGWSHGGYVFAAKQIGLIESEPESIDEPITRGEAAEAVYKALDVDLMSHTYAAGYRVLEGETILTGYWDYNKIECEVREALKNEVTVVVIQNLSNRTNFVTGQYVSFSTDADFRDAIGERVTVYATNAKQGANYILFKVEN